MAPVGVLGVGSTGCGVFEMFQSEATPGLGECMGEHPAASVDESVFCSSASPPCGWHRVCVLRYRPVGSLAVVLCTCLVYVSGMSVYTHACAQVR